MQEVFRRSPERRTGKDRRRFFSVRHFLYRGPERRDTKRNRRSREERRDGWIRVNKWSSVNLQVLKISKFLKDQD
jgi:hypothetical protein